MATSHCQWPNWRTYATHWQGTALTIQLYWSPGPGKSPWHSASAACHSWRQAQLEHSNHFLESAKEYDLLPPDPGSVATHRWYWILLWTRLKRWRLWVVQKSICDEANRLDGIAYYRPLGWPRSTTRRRSSKHKRAHSAVAKLGCHHWYKHVRGGCCRLLETHVKLAKAVVMEISSRRSIIRPISASRNCDDLNAVTYLSMVLLQVLWPSAPLLGLLVAHRSVHRHAPPYRRWTES